MVEGALITCGGKYANTGVVISSTLQHEASVIKASQSNIAGICSLTSVIKL